MFSNFQAFDTFHIANVSIQMYQLVLQTAIYKYTLFPDNLQTAFFFFNLGSYWRNVMCLFPQSPSFHYFNMQIVFIPLNPILCVLWSMKDLKAFEEF